MMEGQVVQWEDCQAQAVDPQSLAIKLVRWHHSKAAATLN